MRDRQIELVFAMIKKLVPVRSLASSIPILLGTATAVLLLTLGSKNVLSQQGELEPSVRASSPEIPSGTPLWFQSSGEDNPASVENDTPFPNSKLIVNAEWASPRYYPNPKIQAADIIPVTWASDGHSYVIGDDGFVQQAKGTTVIARIIGGPPKDNSGPNMNFQLLAHDVFPYGCPKSISANSCYSVGFTNVNGVFYAATYDKGYPIVGDHPPGHARIDYSIRSISQTSWRHGTKNFPQPVDSGVMSFVEIGRGKASHDDCSARAFPQGCIYAIVLQGGYQDPKDRAGMDQFNATHIYLGRAAVGTPKQHYQEVLNPRRWQWFAGFDPNDRPTWIQASGPQLPRAIRSLSYPHNGRPGCAKGGQGQCRFWNQAPGQAGHVNYPHMVYDRALNRYLLTFTDWYYRDSQPASESGPMVQGGTEAIVLESPHPWGPWSFVMRSPYFGSGNGYGPSFPVQWEGPRTSEGQNLWMVWAANFSGCGKPLLVPVDLCQGVYGMNLRRVHFTLSDTRGSVRRPWYDQNIGFASRGHASFGNDAVKVIGNGNLSVAPDPFGQFKDKLHHDAFRYVFQRVQGNGTIEAQLHSPILGAKSTPGPEASTGLMIRESTYVIGHAKNNLLGQRLSLGDTFSETARYVYIGVTKDGSLFFQYRDENRILRSRTQPNTCSGGCHLRISRQNNRVTAYFSGANQVFHEAGSHTFSQPLSNSVTMGMVATSDSASTFPQYASYGNKFSNVQIFGRSTAAAISNWTSSNGASAAK